MRPKIGEWRFDEFGRRYRMIGNSREYEPTIRVNGIDIPQSELENYYQRQRESERRNNNGF